MPAAKRVVINKPTLEPAEIDSFAFRQLIRLPSGSLHTEPDAMGTQRSMGSVQITRHTHSNRPSTVRFLPPRAKGVLGSFVISDEHLDDFILMLDQMKVSLLAARAEASTKGPAAEIVKWVTTPEWRTQKATEAAEQERRGDEYAAAHPEEMEDLRQAGLARDDRSRFVIQWPTAS